MIPPEIVGLLKMGVGGGIMIPPEIVYDTRIVPSAMNAPAENGMRR